MPSIKTSPRFQRTKSAYSEKLKDPRWQKIRLEVMQANDFCCEICGDSESTLHVHHKEYFKGREPWEYSKKQLAVICDSCHEQIHSAEDFLRNVCSFAALDGPGSRDEIACLIAAHIGISYEDMLKMSNWEDCSFPRAAHEAGLAISENLDRLSKLHYQAWLKEQSGVRHGKD